MLKFLNTSPRIHQNIQYISGPSNNTAWPVYPGLDFTPREFPEPSQESGRFSLRNKNSVIIPYYSNCNMIMWARSLFYPKRILINSIIHMRTAMSANGTVRTERAIRCTDLSSQIHNGLVKTAGFNGINKLRKKGMNSPF